MTIETLPITSRAEWLRWRTQDVTASTIGALLGVHTYATPYGLWALKSGLIEEDPEENAAMRRGRLLEPVAVALIREERPDWKLDTEQRYYRDPVARIGATPDLLAYNEAGERGAVQIKTVNPMTFRDSWIDPETRETTPPLWIAAQAIIEAHLTDSKWAAVAALVVGHGLDLHIVDVPVHAALIGKIKQDVALFWKFVEDKTPPPADYARDGEILAQLYAIDNGSAIDLTGDNELTDMLYERENLTTSTKAAKARLDEIKSAILSKVGVNAAAKVGDFVIGAKTVHRAAYSVKATDYRNVRVKRITGKGTEE